MICRRSETAVRYLGRAVRVALTSTPPCSQVPSKGFRHAAAARYHHHRGLGSGRDCTRICGPQLALDDPHTPDPSASAVRQPHALRAYQADGARQADGRQGYVPTNAGRGITARVSWNDEHLDELDHLDLCSGASHPAVGGGHRFRDDYMSRRITLCDGASLHGAVNTNAKEIFLQMMGSGMNGGRTKIREGTSAILISTDGRLLFQLRDDIPDISDPGMLDFFGGGREGDESFLDCVVREVHEEIGLYLPPERFERIGRYVEPDHWLPDCTLHSEIFVARDVPVDRLMIMEGSLKIVAFDELGYLHDLLAPTAKHALEVFLKISR